MTTTMQQRIIDSNKGTKANRDGARRARDELLRAMACGEPILSHQENELYVLQSDGRTVHVPRKF